MKKLLSLSSILLLCCAACSHSDSTPSSGGNPVAPAALNLGDKVIILSLGSTPDSGVAQKAADVIRQWGFTPVVSANCYARHGEYAGTDTVRRNDLLTALRDTSIHAIISTRGGYGTSQLLYGLPLDTLRKYPKWIVGYSDITAMHSALVSAGIQSIHGNMGGALAERGPNDSINLMLRNILLGDKPDYIVPGHHLNHPGTASGILIGGNMSVFGGLSGSKDYDFLDRDRIAGQDIVLFFEDVSESMPRVISMLYQLKLKGVFTRVKGVIVGHFTDYKAEYGYADMAELLNEYLVDLPDDVPVCYDFPASHDELRNYPLIEGAPVELTVSKEQTHLQFR